MKKALLRFSLSLSVVTLVLGFCLSAPLFAQCNPAPQPLPNIPTALSRFFIIVGNNTFTDATYGSTGPRWGGNFDIDIMGRNAAAQTARRNEAISFFSTRFGVDFTGATAGDVNGDGNNEYITTDGKFMLQYVMVPDPYDNGTYPADFGQKVVYSGGETVPSAGWIAHEAYYVMLVLTDYATLAGTYVSSSEVQSAYPGATSLPVLAGTYAVNGEYRIDYLAPCTGNIDLNYSSLRPTFPDIIANAFGYTPTASIDYSVSFDPSNGLTGIARGTARLEYISGTTYQAKSRIIIKLN